MIYGEASTTVTAPPAQVLDLVCDLERYKLADTKIRKVLGTRIDGSWLSRDLEAEVSRLGQLLGTTTTGLTKAES